MSDTEIAAAPVLIPLTVVALGVVIGCLRRHELLTAPRAVTGVLACLCGAAVLNYTLFPFTLFAREGLPWHTWLNLTPFTDIVDDPIGLVLNTALFVPVGFLLPLVVRVPSAGRALLYGVSVSLVIEIVQFVADLAVGLGRVFDVDDLITNAVGALIGHVVFRLAVLVPALARVATVASWRTYPARSRQEARELS